MTIARTKDVGSPALLPVRQIYRLARRLTNFWRTPGTWDSRRVRRSRSAVLHEKWQMVTQLMGLLVRGCKLPPGRVRER